MSFEKTTALVRRDLVCPKCDRLVENCCECDCLLGTDDFYCDNCKAMDYHLCNKCGEKLNGDVL